MEGVLSLEIVSCICQLCALLIKGSRPLAEQQFVLGRTVGRGLLRCSFVVPPLVFALPLGQCLLPAPKCADLNIWRSFLLH